MCNVSVTHQNRRRRNQSQLALSAKSILVSSAGQNGLYLGKGKQRLVTQMSAHGGKMEVDNKCSVWTTS